MGKHSRRQQGVCGEGVERMSKSGEAETIRSGEKRDQEKDDLSCQEHGVCVVIGAGLLGTWLASESSAAKNP